MKSSDIAMIILIASISVGVAYAAVSAIPGIKLAHDPVKVKTIPLYSASIGDPDTDIFNKDAINPTVDVTIGGTTPAGQ